MSRNDEIQTGEIMTENIVDVDATWDGKGSLDEHRQKTFAEMTQPGFGIKSDKSKARDAAIVPEIQPTIQPVSGDDNDGE